MVDEEVILVWGWVTGGLLPFLAQDRNICGCFQFGSALPGIEIFLAWSRSKVQSKQHESFQKQIMELEELQVVHSKDSITNHNDSSPFCCLSKPVRQ